MIGRCVSICAGRCVNHLRQVSRGLTTMIDVESLIHQHTEITDHHLTPEIELHLITTSCALWYSRIEDCPFPDPFWSFYWPGGQAISRFILDNKQLFKDKSILDVGSGCGASAIACAKAGAKRVVANDIDPVALTAIRMNAELNNVVIETDCNNRIGQCQDLWNFIVLGDMFYDTDFSKKLFEWIKYHINKKTRVLLGDPGRIFFMETLPSLNLELLAQYPLTLNCKKENYGLTHGNVWEFVSHPHKHLHQPKVDDKNEE